MRERSTSTASPIRLEKLRPVAPEPLWAGDELIVLRFTKGPLGAAILVAASALFWILAPVVAARRRLERADLWRGRDSGT